ncbi:MAG: Hint domain-containing protein [Pseudomonadota bacterium]
MSFETLSYVYQLSDFDTSGSNITPPDEQGAQAQGSPPFNITLSPGASPFQVNLEDGSDDGFDEVNSADQLLTQPVTLDGVTYPIGSRILVNYGLEDANGFQLFSITIGAGNSGNNDTTAVITNSPLVPGQQYTFIREFNVGRSEIPYATVACFVRGTQILTSGGEVAVEDLRAGDQVICKNGHPKTLRMVLSTDVDVAKLQANPKLRPIRIKAGALGPGLPARALWVSPQHRMLVSSVVAKRMFGTPEVLISATKLAPLPGVRIDDSKRDLRYFHLVFDRHEIVFAESAPAESLLIAPAALKTMSLEARQELAALFPHAVAGNGAITTARLIPDGKSQRELVARLLKNHKKVVESAS